MTQPPLSVLSQCLNSLNVLELVENAEQELRDPVSNPTCCNRAHCCEQGESGSYLVRTCCQIAHPSMSTDVCTCCRMASPVQHIPFCCCALVLLAADMLVKLAAVLDSPRPELQQLVDHAWPWVIEQVGITATRQELRQVRDSLLL